MRRFVNKTFVLLTLLFMYASASFAQEAAAQAGEILAEPKKFLTSTGVEIPAEAGHIFVPENRTSPSSNMIQLAFVRLKSNAADPKAPLIYIAGGPGQSSTWFAEDPWTLSEWAPVLDVCDLIFLDQRATGKSKPRLVYRSQTPTINNAFVDENAAAMLRFLKGGDVSEVNVTLPPLVFVPLDGYDPQAAHPSVSLSQQLLAIVSGEGLDAALATYRQLKTGHDGDTERDINELGYQLLARGRTDDAIRVFKLNTEDYPDSWNTFDSLAEAYHEAGKAKFSLEMYRKALAMNPQNANAARMIQELSASQ